VLLVGLCAVAMRANAEEAPRVIEVDVEGTHTVAKETCVARLQTRPGMPYTESIVSEDIRRLFALGYFTDVRVNTESRPEGLRVVFQVKEKPAVQDVVFQGMRQFRRDRLRQLLEVKKGDLYDPRKVKEGVDRIKAEYGRKGYSQAEVVTQTQVDEAANTVTVYVLVEEGPRMRIKEILVEGNLAFSDKKIRHLLKTKAHRFWTAGIYSDQVLEEDLERIRVFYRRNGYQDIAVSSQVLADPSGKWLYVHLTLTEGLQHRVGQVEVTGTVLFPEHEVRQTLRLKPGAVYSQEGVQEDLKVIKQYYGDRGYINAQIVPEMTLDQTTKRVNVTYRIVENELAYVQRIDIRGNLRTKDVVIRRELRVYPGQPFNGKQIRRSIERLYNLGYFEEVNVDTEPTSQPNHEDLIVEVKEAKTGSFSFGGGFSSVDRLVGLVEVEQRNFDWRNFPTFTGAGQDMRLRAEIGTVRRYFDLSFTEPWMLGYPVSFGVDLYNRTRLSSRELGLGYEEQQRGVGLRLGKEFFDTLRIDTNYQFYRTEISNVADEASADLKAEQGRNNISMLGTTVSWDSRDNHFDPTRGFFVFSSADVAGSFLAGDRDFYRLQSGFSWYVPHLDRLVLELRTRTGLVKAYGNSSEVPIFERFFAGGSNTIRGFRERRVGPRDPLSNDPIGGEVMFVGTLEEVLTVVKDERDKPILKSSLFCDVGNVWRRVSEYGESLKAGVGVGLRVTTPIGPVRLDLGFPMTQLNGEKRTPRLHFNVSRSF